MLDVFGVDFIEVGHPAVSADIYKAIKEINKLSINAKTVAHCRLKKEDIEQACLNENLKKFYRI